MWTRVWTRAVVMLALAGLAACAAPSESELGAERASAIEDSVRRLLAEYAAQVSAGEWAAVREMYLDDPRFHWVEEGVVRYESVEAVRDAIGSLVDMLETRRFSGGELDLHDVRVIPLAPGVAHATAAFEQRFTRTEGQPLAFSGALTFLALHTDEGWRFLAGHTSNPSESPAGET